MMITRITSTTRSTNKPPPYSPFNFGINEEWYKEYKDEPTFQILLRTWGRFDDPPGFGANAENVNAAEAIDAPLISDTPGT